MRTEGSWSSRLTSLTGTMASGSLGVAAGSRGGVASTMPSSLATGTEMTLGSVPARGTSLLAIGVLPVTASPIRMGNTDIGFIGARVCWVTRLLPLRET